jgi:hypothetical protein
MVMETKLYRAISSASVVVPAGPEYDEVAESYGAMATAGRVNETQRRVLRGTDLFTARRFIGQLCGRRDLTACFANNRFDELTLE